MATQTDETYQFDPIQGYPRLNWKGKRPFRSTQYYPAQLKETYADEVDGWRNKIYWGDNLQVMSHLLKTYRGKINLIYIDPPYDSNADYKMTIKLRGKEVKNDRTAFEEKQYTDIWTNDEYLQFMYERLILMRELLAWNGSIYVHCDWRRSAHLRLVLDEIFCSDCFQREIIWRIGWISGYKTKAQNWIRNHETIFFYTKSKGSFTFNKEYIPYADDYVRRDGKKPEGPGYPIEDTWNCSDIDRLDSIQIMSFNTEKTGYVTQKNESLLERIITVSSNPGDIVFDCFMGSGTTQAVAMKLGRRFIGADINLGAVEATTKRLLKIQGNAGQEDMDLEEEGMEEPKTSYTGFEVYNVNHYDVFRNPVEAKNLIIEALEIQPLPAGGIYDGEKDGRMVKIMPINRITTRADLNELKVGFDNRVFEQRQREHPTRPVEKLLLVCMGHEPDLKAELEKDVSFKLDIEITDILRDKSKLEFKREAEAEIVRRNGHLIIEQFYPMNLLQKLSLMKENVENWKELVESVKIDFNYDGAVMTPSVVDSPEKDELVKGTYHIPEDAGTIRVKITDLLSESLEMTVE